MIWVKVKFLKSIFVQSSYNIAMWIRYFATVSSIFIHYAQLFSKMRFRVTEVMGYNVTFENILLFDTMSCAGTAKNIHLYFAKSSCNEKDNNKINKNYITYV